MGKKKLLLLGWDAADWDVIDDLMAKGQMPALKRVLDKGVKGNLATLDPPISPMLWTTIATGVSASKHGIVGFVEPDPNGNGVRPLNSSSRNVKAIWNILSENGLKCNVVGWWPSHPAEEINGVMVSNFFQMVSNNDPQKWKMVPGTVFPSELSETLADFRVHPSELTPAHILPFSPLALHVDSEKDKTPAIIAKLIAHGASIQAAATWLMQHTEWDLMAVYFDMIDHFSHLAMKYRPPYREGIPMERYEAYKDVVNSAYRFQDMMLDRMLDLIDEDTSILILSDHGFHSGPQRPKYLPVEPAGPTHEHSPYGMIVLSGKDFKQKERIFGSTLYDITPTVLQFFGLPVSAEMKGNVLKDAWKDPVEIKRIPSYESETDHAKSKTSSGWDATEALKQLVELGYIEPIDPDHEKALLTCKAEASYYLARSLMQDHEYQQAEKAILEAIQLRPDVFRFRTLLVQVYFHLNDFVNAENALHELNNWKEKTDTSIIDFLEARLFHLQYRSKKALQAYKKVLEKAPNSLDIKLRIAQIYKSTARYDKAIEWLDQVLEIDPRNETGLYERGSTLLKKGDPEAAIDDLLEAIELKWFFPMAHYSLGEAFVQLGNFSNALEAFLVVTRIQPGYLRAHAWLAKLYKEQFNRIDLAEPHEKIVQSNRKGELKVLSSLQGVVSEKDLKPWIEDGSLQTVNTNELTQGTSIFDQNKWLWMSSEQVLKLPADITIQLIWVEGDWNDMLRDQQILMGRGNIAENTFPVGLDKKNKDHLQIFRDWLLSRPDIEVELFNKNDLIEKLPQLLNK